MLYNFNLIFTMLIHICIYKVLRIQFVKFCKNSYKILIPAFHYIKIKSLNIHRYTYNTYIFGIAITKAQNLFRSP